MEEEAQKYHCYLMAEPESDALYLEEFDEEDRAIWEAFAGLRT